MPSVRFLLCGGAATFINWLVRFPLSNVLPFQVAIICAYGVGMVLGFLLYRAFVWQMPDTPLYRQITMFITVNIVNIVGVVAVATVVVLALHSLGIPEFYAQALAHGVGIVAGAVANYFGHARFTFAPVKVPAKPVSQRA